MTVASSASSAVALAPVFGPWVALIFALAMILKAWQPFRKMALDRDAGEIGRLTATVERMDKELNTVRREFAEERLAHERETTDRRHQLRNAKQEFNLLLELLEMNPDRVSEVIAKVRAVQAANERNLSAERGERTRSIDHEGD